MASSGDNEHRMTTEEEYQYYILREMPQLFEITVNKNTATATTKRMLNNGYVVSILHEQLLFLEEGECE